MFDIVSTARSEFFASFTHPIALKDCFTMDVIRKVKCVVVNDQEFQVEGFGRRTGDGLFQSACKIVSIAGDVTETNRLTFQIFTKDPDLAAEVALLCGADAVAKGALACQ